MSDKSLGLISVPDRTIEHDLTLLERFQEFSAELLRVALIAISAIGFVVSRIAFPEKDAKLLGISPAIKYLIVASLVLLAISAAAALIHRYYAVDCMSWHLQAMRRYVRNSETEVKKANTESDRRHKEFKVANRAIACSAFALGAGAVLLVTATIIAIL